MCPWLESSSHLTLRESSGKSQEGRRQEERERDIHTYRHTYRQTERLTYRDDERETDRQDRQIELEREEKFPLNRMVMVRLRRS